MLFAVDFICADKAGTGVKLCLYTLQYTIRLSPEIVPEACPKQVLIAVPTEEFNQALVGPEGLTQPSPSSCAAPTVSLDAGKH